MRASGGVAATQDVGHDRVLATRDPSSTASCPLHICFRVDPAHDVPFRQLISYLVVATPPDEEP